VQAVLKYQTTRLANGKSVEMHLHHFFRFHDGKIAYCRSTEDTSQTEVIFRD
jgi:ketosteroid isomerase-like protein